MRQLYLIQALIVIGAAVALGILNFEDKLKWLNICRYILYIVTIHAIPQVYTMACNYKSSTIANIKSTVRGSANYILIYTACVCLLVYHRQRIYEEELVCLFLAFLVYKYPEMSAKDSISYGVGMACSYYEGYLTHVLPSDGASFGGFESNIRALEDQEGVLFPVKKLFIIITKSLYCPPDLKDFNKHGTDVPHLEAFNSLEDVTKSVAGVRNRSYRNTAYSVRRRGAPAVPLCAECATPLHTLYRVLDRTWLYQQLSGMDTSRVVEEFCSTLRAVTERSLDTRGKCHLVYYDHEDPTQNLAEILLKTIEQFEPDFEHKILERRNENVLDPSVQSEYD